MSPPLHSLRSLRFERLLAIALVCVSLFHAGQMTVAMATSSLSTDEFGTVGTFSARGPMRVLTDYRAPKNHILFNLINSVLPGRGSWNPARVRALSILASLLTLAAIIAYTAARDQLMEGAVIVALWTFAPEALSLSMEARGYGFLGLFAILAAISLMEYTRTGRRGWLAALALASVLGTYTVPSFLFLAAPLLLLLWITRRTRETFIAGAITAAVILLLYVPVLGQLIRAFGDFHAGEEVEFGSIASLWHTVRLYLLPCENWQAACLLGAFLLAPFVVARHRPRGERLGACLVAAACACYLGTLVLLRTPPLRMAACGLLPAAFAGIISAGAGIRHGLPPLVRSILFAATAAALLFFTVLSVRDFDFIPSENWTLAAQAIEAAFPASTKVDYSRYAKYLRQTLPSPTARAADFDAASFASGRLVVADAGNKWAEGRRFHAPPDVPRVGEMAIPGRIRDIVLTFRLPERRGIEVLPAALADGNVASDLPIPGDGYPLKFEPPVGGHALVILLDRPVTKRMLRVESNRPDILLAGNAVILPLDPKSQGPVEITLHPLVPGIAMSEMWISQ